MIVHMKWDGKTYDWDPEDITVQQAIVIKLAFGWTLTEWQEACSKVDPHAFQALYWLMRVQGGESCRLEDQDFSIKKFSEAFEAAQNEAAQSEGQAARGNVETPSRTPGLAMTSQS